MMNDDCTCMENSDDKDYNECSEEKEASCRESGMYLNVNTCTCIEREDDSSDNGECSEEKMKACME